MVRDGREPLSFVVASQDELHAPYGGVVPELACRRHVHILDAVVQEALVRAGLGLTDLTAVAVTAGPGLFGALTVGVSYAKALSYGVGCPLLAVNHLEGHIAAIVLEKEHPTGPYIALIASGGHTDLYAVQEPGRYHLLGRTLDDAAGEALDKAAKALGLGYPGGPAIEDQARQGDPTAIAFPRPLSGAKTHDFSFSGLKTALVYHLAKLSHEALHAALPGIAASYQQAVVDVLVVKTMAAAAASGMQEVVVTGGVAANGTLRAQMQRAGEARGYRVFFPRPAYCTDNGAMIAAAGAWQLQRGGAAPLDLTPDADLPLGG